MHNDEKITKKNLIMFPHNIFKGIGDLRYIYCMRNKKIAK